MSRIQLPIRNIYNDELDRALEPKGKNAGTVENGERHEAEMTSSPLSSKEPIPKSTSVTSHGLGPLPYSPGMDKCRWPGRLSISFLVPAFAVPDTVSYFFSRAFA